MTMQLSIPTQIVAGDSCEWRDSLPDRPPPDYSLSWSIVGVSSSLALVSAADNGDFVTVISSAESAELAPGPYRWQAYSTKDGNRKTIGEGRLTVTPNLAELDTFDDRTDAEKMLAEVERAINAVMTSGQEYKIKDREFTRANLSELMAWRTQLKAQVFREKQARVGASPNFKIRFARP